MSGKNTLEKIGSIRAALFIFAIIVVTIILALHAHRSPTPAPLLTPVTEYSAERALAHVQAIAKRPHPAGTQANAEVRDYIMRRIQEFGEKPEIQEAVVNRQPGMASTPQNILVRVKGSDNTLAVALAAHYDSVLFGPGAADDGAGVAALLETLRALKSGSQLRNDVIFVFTDAEEGLAPKSGRRGGAAFARSCPWTKEIGAILNFDCRGTGGPAYMYETSPNNGWLIERMIASGCHPLANSSAAEISRRMPTGSDFAEFELAGIPGMDFAFLEGLHRYHTRLDTPENLDPASLQHFGEYALKITRELGAADLRQTSAPDAVYFNTFGSAMTHYPQSWTPWIALGELALFLAALAFGIAARSVTLRCVITSALSFLGLGVSMSALMGAIIFIGYKIHGPYFVYVGDCLAFGFLGLTIAAAFIHASAKPGAASMFERSFGVLLIWTALSIATGFLMRGASFFFVYPSLFALFCLIILMTLRRDSFELDGFTLRVTAIACIPTLLLLSPILLGLHFALTIVGAPALMFIIYLILGLFTPQLRVIAAPRRLIPPGLALLMFAAGLILAATTFRFDSDHMKFTSLSYAIDDDAHQAFWLSCNPAPDEWTSQFFKNDATLAALPEFLGDVSRKYLKGAAPDAALTPPKLELLEDSTTGDARMVRLHLSSPRKAPRAFMFAQSPIDVISTEANGVKLLDVAGPWRLSYDQLPESGVDITLVLKPGAKIKIRAVDCSYELPEIPGLNPTPQPDYMAVMPNTLDFNKSLLKSSQTLVAKTFDF